MENSKITDRVFVHVEKSFNVPAERVFDAWLDVASMRNWMFGPSVRDEEIVSLNNDPRPQGRFSFVVKRGNEILDHTGTYLEIQRPARLVFTWGVNMEGGAESVVKIDIRDTPEGCHLKLEHDMDVKWAEYAERTQEGWTYMLNLLGKWFSGAGI